MKAKPFNYTVPVIREILASLLPHFGGTELISRDRYGWKVRDWMSVGTENAGARCWGSKIAHTGNWRETAKSRTCRVAYISIPQMA